MNIKPKILKWSLIIVSLFAIQTLTYFTIAERQLKNKLLPDYFAKLTHNSDSIYVRDFFVYDCGNINCVFYSSDLRASTSQNLNNNEKFIKEKFGVSFVYFEDPERYNANDTSEKKYNLVYKTWARRREWPTVIGAYTACQTETLLTDNKYLYEREGTYIWILFFWFQTFERFESSDVHTEAR